MRGNPVIKVSIQDTVYKTLRDSILSLQLKPGSIMSTQEMAGRLSVSRTPVREAFIRLNEESLVEIIPQKETKVSLIDMDRVREERFIRENLELAVIRPFMEKVRPEDIPRLQGYLRYQETYVQEENPAEFLASDQELHREFFLVAGRPLAWETLQGVNGHDYRFRILALSEKEAMEKALQEHQKLLELIQEGDPERVYQELSSHLSGSAGEVGVLKQAYPAYFVS